MPVQSWQKISCFIPHKPLVFATISHSDIHEVSKPPQVFFSGQEGWDQQVALVPQEGHLKLIQQVDDVRLDVLGTECSVAEEETQILCMHDAWKNRHQYIL